MLKVLMFFGKQVARIQFSRDMAKFDVAVPHRVKAGDFLDVEIDFTLQFVNKNTKIFQLSFESNNRTLDLQ